MHPQFSARVFAIASLCCSAFPVWSGGLHLGWCQGVGNPHQSSACGGGTTVLPPVLGQNPVTANPLPLPGGTTGQTAGTSPTVVYLHALPPKVISGYSPTYTLQPLPGGSFTGTSPAIVVTPQAPQVIVGFGPVTPVTPVPTPSFTGFGPVPVTIYPVPPKVFTGFAPVVQVQPIQSPSFTGYGLPPITVLPLPPQVLTGFAPVPATIVVHPVLAPSFTGYGAVPTPVPQAIPQPVPQAIPQPLQPQLTPTVITRPQPKPHKLIAHNKKPTVTLVPAGTSPSQSMVTNKPGRQPGHNVPEFAAKDGGGNWGCVASGHGLRKLATGRATGGSNTLRHVGAIDVMGRDLPALHPGHADCIIAVRRKK